MSTTPKNNENNSSGSRQQTTLQKLVTFAKGRRELGVLGALLLIGLFFSVMSDRFLTTPNMLNIMRQVSINGLIIIAMTFVIISKDIDLSVGASYAVVGIVVATLFTQYSMNIWLASVLGLITGGLLGLFNGVIAVKGQIPAFIVTLGTMMIYRGLALVISGGRPISVRLPEAYFNVTGARVFGNIPVPALWFVGVAIFGAFLLHRTSYGYKVFAVGGNVEAAHLSGINTDRVRITNFILTGMAAGLAGIISVSYLTGITPTAGQGMELQVIAGTVVGGTSLFGGVGTIGGSFIGAMIMGVVRNGLVMIGTSAYLIELIIGLVLIAAVFVSTYSYREKR